MATKKSYPRGLRAGITPADAYRIAAEAGVSHHTVYAVLEGAGAHAANERKVRKAMRELGVKQC